MERRACSSRTAAQGKRETDPGPTAGASQLDLPIAADGVTQDVAIMHVSRQRQHPHMPLLARPIMR